MDRSGSIEMFHIPAQDVLAQVLSQQLKVSIFPGGKHQRSEDELSVVRELDAECPMSHRLTRTDLEPFLLLGTPLSTYRHQIF
jgi:hypothetical protein